MFYYQYYKFLLSFFTLFIDLEMLVKETNFTGCDGESKIFEYNHKLLIRQHTSLVIIDSLNLALEQMLDLPYEYKNQLMYLYNDQLVEFNREQIYTVDLKQLTIQEKNNQISQMRNLIPLDFIQIGQYLYYVDQQNVLNCYSILKKEVKQIYKLSQANVKEISLFVNDKNTIGIAGYSQQQIYIYNVISNKIYTIENIIELLGGKRYVLNDKYIVIIAPQQQRQFIYMVNLQNYIYTKVYYSSQSLEKCSFLFDQDNVYIVDTNGQISFLQIQLNKQIAIDSNQINPMTIRELSQQTKKDDDIFTDIIIEDLKTLVKNGNIKRSSEEIVQQVAKYLSMGGNNKQLLQSIQKRIDELSAQNDRQAQQDMGRWISQLFQEADQLKSETKNFNLQKQKEIVQKQIEQKKKQQMRKIDRELKIKQ